MRAHLESAGVTLKEYSAMLGDVRTLAAEGVHMWADPSKVSYALLRAATEGAESADGAGSRGKKKDPAGKRKRAAGEASDSGMCSLSGMHSVQSGQRCSGVKVGRNAFCGVRPAIEACEGCGECSLWD